MLESVTDFFRDEENRSIHIAILVLFRLLLPYGFALQEDPDWHNYQLYAAVWVFRDWCNVHGDMASGIIFPDPIAFLNSFVLIGFGYLFTVQIVRHHKGQTTQKNVWLLAVLSLFPLTPILFLSLIGYPLYAGGGISGPVPLFLVIGLVIDRYWGNEPPEQPWDEED